MSLTPEWSSADPLKTFVFWLESAEKLEPHDHNAMVLATVDAAGAPHARVVLLRGLSGREFRFFTNYQSAKGQDLQARPVAELCFYWKSLGRQVRVSGAVARLAPEESDAYFSSRPRGHQIGAWASLQSQEAPSAAALEDRIREAETRFEGREEVPRPPHWGGFGLAAQRIEFWIQGENRLHSRHEYLWQEEGRGWKHRILYP